MWNMPMRQLFPKYKMTYNLTTIGHHTAFNNQQHTYCIVGNKGPDMTNLNQFKKEK